MTVILFVPPDPTDLVIPGGVLPTMPTAFTPFAASTFLLAGPRPEPEITGAFVELGETPEQWGPEPVTTSALLYSQKLVPMLNATICTSYGTCIDVMLTGRPNLGMPFMSTTRWVIAGTTRDSNDAALPGCQVIVLDVGRLVAGEAPVVNQTISSLVDGTFSIDVPGNMTFQIIAYLPGSPSRAGITLYPLTPTTIG